MDKIIDLQKKPEKTLLVLVDFKKHDKNWTFDDERAEFIALVESTGLDILEDIRVPRDKPDAATYIGKGKVEEIKEFCSDDGVDVIIFNKDLSAKQQRNLEERLEVKIIDRTQMILDIFAAHAKTKLGKLQVELAQLEYALPRLSGQWSAMMRQKGGIGLRGPGETKLEVDKRKVLDKISYIKKEMSHEGVHRELLRKKRQNSERPYVAFVGYTSAGKTSLLNALTDAGKDTNADYFTTLDTVTRVMEIADKDEVLLADTVGFVHDLPQKLVDAFMSTLEELQYADLLLHVVDVANVHYRKMQIAVESLLKILKLKDKPTLYVYNKIDLLDDFAKDKLSYFHPEDNNAFVSSLSKEGLDELLEKIQDKVQTAVHLSVVVDADCSEALNFIYKYASIHSSDSEGKNSIVFELSMKRKHWASFMDDFSAAVSNFKNITR